MLARANRGVALLGVISAYFAIGSANGGPWPPVSTVERPAAVGQLRVATPALPPKVDFSHAGPGGKIWIAPPGTHPFGRTYGEWAIAWWQWALATSASVNPLLDPRSSACDIGVQPAHVRFIGGNFGGGAGDPPVERHCTVPAGTALFFPVLNGVWASTPTPKHGCDVAGDPWYGTRPGDPGYRVFLDTVYKPAGIDPKNPKGSLTLTVDKEPIHGIEQRYLISRVFFHAVLAKYNIFDAILKADCFDSINLSPDVTFGYYIFLAPLPPGRHTLRWKADATLPILGKLHQDVTYHITVQPRH